MKVNLARLVLTLISRKLEPDRKAANLNNAAVQQAASHAKLILDWTLSNAHASDQAKWYDINLPFMILLQAGPREIWAN